MTEKHLAQINVARARFDLDAPEMADFVGALDKINALAESQDGFVWRLQDEAGDATAFRIWDDPRVIVNMSVWRSIEALAHFAYETAHVRIFARREKWFAPLGRAHMALWWIDAGTTPTVEDAQARLDALEANGPSPEAFTFGSAFSPEGVPVAPSKLACQADAGFAQRRILSESRRTSGL
ncbi:MAG: DUF3291 domain-containing protein [Maricaulaceae bacterium]|jgi:hypothetical protein